MSLDGWGGNPYWDDTEDGEIIDFRDADPNRKRLTPKINKPIKPKYIKRKTMNDNMDMPEWYDDLPEKADRSKGKGYKRMHETGNGRKLPIAAMDDKHLENTINLFVDKMINIKDQALYEVGESGDMFYQELNGIQKMDKSTAINIISNIMYKLEPYFTELVIRGNVRYITNLHERLDRVLGRNKLTGRHLLK